jgi:hypothetical protein
MIENAKKAFDFRISDKNAAGAEIKYSDTLKKIFGRLDPNSVKGASIFAIGSGVLYLAYQIVKRRKNKKASDKSFVQLTTKEKLKVVLFEELRIDIVFAMALFPFVWYFVIPNHSYIHSFFTFRALFVAFFAIYALLFKIGYDISKSE